MATSAVFKTVKQFVIQPVAPDQPVSPGTQVPTVSTTCHLTVSDKSIPVTAMLQEDVVMEAYPAHVSLQKVHPCAIRHNKSILSVLEMQMDGRIHQITIGVNITAARLHSKAVLKPVPAAVNVLPD